MYNVSPLVVNPFRSVRSQASITFHLRYQSLPDGTLQPTLFVKNRQAFGRISEVRDEQL